MISINKIRSINHITVYSIPQGTVFEPFLFNIFINIDQSQTYISFIMTTKIDGVNVKQKK